MIPGVCSSPGSACKPYLPCASSVLAAAFPGQGCELPQEPHEGLQPAWYSVCQCANSAKFETEKSELMYYLHNPGKMTAYVTWLRRTQTTQYARQLEMLWGRLLNTCTFSTAFILLETSCPILC